MKAKLFKNFKEMEDSLDNPERKVVGDTTLLLDISYLFKAHFSANTDVTDMGVPIAGVTGVINNISKFVDKFNATQVIAVFDGVKSRKRRQEILESYKGNRDKSSNIQSKFDMDTDSLLELDRLQKQVLYELLGLLPVKRLYYEELEADDIIGYLTKTHFSDEEGRRIIVSADKDFYQLIDDHTEVYHPRKKLVVNRHNFRDQWDTLPENIIYYRIIEGDSSDNIKGIKGWGTKTIEKFFPELKAEEIDSFDDFQELITSKSAELSKTKTGAKILNQREVLPDNHILMDLSRTMLSPDEKMSLKKVMQKETKNTLQDFFRFKQRCAELQLNDNIYMMSIQRLFNTLKY